MDYDTTQLPDRYDAGRSHGADVLELWMRAIESRIGDAPVSRILDLGCGTGRFTNALASHFNARVLGLDPSLKMLGYAKAKAHDERVEYQQGFAEAIPLSTGAVDLVFMSMCFHHFRDRNAAAQECRRVLRPGGSVFMRTGTSTRGAEYPTTPFFPATIDLMNEHLPTVEQIVSTFTDAGFRRVSVEVITQVIAPDWQAYAEKLATGSDSILARLPAAAFDAGLAAIRAKGAGPAGGIVEPIDVFVFR